ncbi:hypothetical protein DPMN_054452 [Dreissena polymorpha]|uniref:Uncharacterized protein n=1 Tax=Dreissena polymorpha TaxID=45954 RepID=A0A9D4CQL7_DREPO|nr:hypothetical protein DPMN_054452 [Dreissena polymorpha]
MIPRNVHGDLKDDFKDKVVSRQSALNFLAHKRSAVYYQSITCECCQYQCGVAEMRSYCSDDDDMWSMFKKRSDRIASSTNTASAEKELNDLG